MVMGINFMVLGVHQRIKRKHQPSSVYFEVTLMNNVDSPIEQWINLLVTLKDIMNSNSFSTEARGIARNFHQTKGEHRDGAWLNNLVTLRIAVVSALQHDSKAQLPLLTK